MLVSYPQWMLHWHWQCQESGGCDFNGEGVWVTVYLGPDLDLVPFAKKYTTSLYFLTTTLCGAGFGDITAVNDVERAFLVGVFVVGSLLHVTIFANIAAQIEGSTTSAYVCIQVGLWCMVYQWIRTRCQWQCTILVLLPSR